MIFSVICHCFILEIVDTYQEKRQNSTTEISLGAVDRKSEIFCKIFR